MCDVRTTRLIEADSAAGLLSGRADGHCVSKSPANLLPVWQLELLAPATVIDEEEQLVLDSCRQLVAVFQQLSTHLFGLSVGESNDDDFNNQDEKENTQDNGQSRSLGRTTRVIDVVMNSDDVADFFDNSLIISLIDGRFAAGLPSARICNSAAFLVPVTQAVYRLAVEGQSTGFLTGHSLEGRQVGKSLPDIAAGGGASLLLHWLNSLSGVTQQTRSNEIIDQVRKMLSDVEQFRNTRVVGDKSCSKPDTQTEQLQGDSEDISNLDEEEFQVYRRQAAVKSDTGNQKYFTPSLTELLESKAARENLVRFLDLGHFHFPMSRVSQTVISLLEQINAVSAETESLLKEKVHTASQVSAGDTASAAGLQLVQTSSLALIEALVELVPHLILLYTSLIPVFHSSLLDSDLYLAAIYHNSCLFLAHECLTLGELRLFPLLKQLTEMERHIPDKNKELDPEQETDSEEDELALLRRTVSCSTFVLVPQLRASGTEILLTHLRRHRASLSDHLKRTKGLKDVGLPENRQRCKEAMDACQTILMSVAEGLSPLPLTTFSRCIGYLCNFVCNEVVKDVLALLDLTQTDCEVLVDMLTELEHTSVTPADPNTSTIAFDSASDTRLASGSEVTHIFSDPPDSELVLDATQSEAYTSSLSRRVPELVRLQGILSVMNASTMAVIEQVLWDGGRGPLSTISRLEASELRGLISALYSKSPARDQLLRELR
ncbi:unnamed protein product [Echinostoma caproni]|uniref:HECT domain-containing protein n=1 Tax=Echinostoma caproni TaxID=27848 RepID=A0A183AAF4_9TREM|nr:unnamed protein product [Echinostoma caproni]